MNRYSLGLIFGTILSFCLNAQCNAQSFEALITKPVGEIIVAPINNIQSPQNADIAPQMPNILNNYQILQNPNPQNQGDGISILPNNIIVYDAITLPPTNNPDFNSPMVEMVAPPINSAPPINQTAQDFVKSYPPLVPHSKIIAPNVIIPAAVAENNNINVSNYSLSEPIKVKNSKLPLGHYIAPNVKSTPPIGPLRTNSRQVNLPNLPDLPKLPNLQMPNFSALNAPLEKRGPIAAIYQDTKTAIVKDVPQNVADVLPWVDKERKNQNYDKTLAIVADSLSRANQSDKEWAKPIANDLAQLARKIETLPNPPQYQEEIRPTRLQNQYSEERDYQARPIWQKTAQNQEVGKRPIRLTNEGVDDIYDRGLIDISANEEANPVANVVEKAPHNSKKPVKKLVKKHTTKRIASKASQKCLCTLRSHK
jgi:hypothetical protein